MPKSTFDIIMAAADAAETTDMPEVEDTGDETGDTGDGETVDETTDETIDETVEDETPILERTNDDEEATEEETDEIADRVAAATSQDEFDKLLDEYGFRMPKPGQKENRLPQSRIRARVKTALQKHAKTFEPRFTELNGKLTAQQSKVDALDSFNAALAATNDNPEAARAFLERIAVIHPAFKSFLGGGQAAAAVAAVPSDIAALGPIPGPDVKYTDGSFGYTPEQMEKRETWLANKARIEAKAEAMSEIDKKYGGLLKDHQAAAARAADAPKIAKEIGGYRTVFGKYFTDQEEKEKRTPGSSDITQWRKANPGSTLNDAVINVLVPKIIADRTRMRQELIKELQQRKAKTNKAPVSHTPSRPVKKANESTEDIVSRIASRYGSDDDDE